MRNHFSIWKTTILGGVIFLLPFAIVVFLIGQVVKIIYTVAAQLDTTVPSWSVGGVSLAVLLATLSLVLLCYAAGLAARRSFGRRFTEKVERNVSLLVPRYTVWKSHLASNLDGDDAAPGMRPVLVKFNELTRLGFEIERTVAGDQVTIFLPGSPDPWNGHVVHVTAKRVTQLKLSFSEAAAICESMGRGAVACLEPAPLP